MTLKFRVIRSGYQNNYGTGWLALAPDDTTLESKLFLTFTEAIEYAHEQVRNATPARRVTVDGLQINVGDQVELVRWIQTPYGPAPELAGGRLRQVTDQVWQLFRNGQIETFEREQWKAAIA